MLVGGIGEGLFALIILFVVLLVTCLVGCNLDGGYVYYLPLFFAVLFVTLILVLAPKVPRSQMDAEKAAQALRVVDNQAVAQAAILAAVCLAAVGGLLALFLSHCIVEVNARSFDD